jgi:hypothetical protein
VNARIVLLGAAAAAFVLNLAGCGEEPKATVYRQGQYQGKPDAQPWANERYKGEKPAWEKDVKARNAAQNEYARVGQ